MTSPYRPRKITLDVLRQLARLDPPEKPQEVYDKESKLIVRHQPTGLLTLYVLLGRGKRERLCNARDVIDTQHPLTLTQVKNNARRVRGEAVTGRDFKSEREQARRIPTLQEFVEGEYGDWLTQHPKKRNPAGTLDRLSYTFVYEKDKNGHKSASRWGRMRLDELTEPEIRAWLKKRNKRGVSKVTTGRDIAILKACLNAAAGPAFRRDGKPLIPENPLAHYVPAKGDDEEVVLAFTHDQEAKLRNALKRREEEKRIGRNSANEWREERDYEPLPSMDGIYVDALRPAVIVSLGTGLRRGELFALTWSCVDFESKTITVRARSSKSGKAREIPMNAEVTQVLRAWMMQQKSRKPADHVFSHDGKPIGSLKGGFYAVLDDAGIERVNSEGKKLVWHSLRHRFGTRLAQGGTDVETVRQLMGHSSILVTGRYFHSDDEQKRNAVEALEQAAS